MRREFEFRTGRTRDNNETGCSTLDVWRKTLFDEESTTKIDRKPTYCFILLAAAVKNCAWEEKVRLDYFT
jgi:hypothetical protein